MRITYDDIKKKSLESYDIQKKKTQEKIEEMEVTTI